MLALEEADQSVEKEFDSFVVGKTKHKFPGCWEAFLRLNENKTELFKYLAEQTIKIHINDSQQLISTYKQHVLCRFPQETDKLSPCIQEEADTRLLLHACDAAKHGTRVAWSK